MDYTTLTDADKLAIARDSLRARESEHFTLSLVASPGSERRKAQLESEIETLKETIDGLDNGDASVAADKKPSEKEDIKPPDNPPGELKTDDDKPKKRRARAKKTDDESTEASK